MNFTKAISQYIVCKYLVSIKFGRQFTYIICLYNFILSNLIFFDKSFFPIFHRRSKLRAILMVCTFFTKKLE